MAQQLTPGDVFPPYKVEEAHQLLAPIYGWFTEGLDTAELQQARTLFEQLV
jgi:predicted ATPase